MNGTQVNPNGVNGKEGKSELATQANVEVGASRPFDKGGWP